MSARSKRGCGYCLNVNCEDYAKGVFLLGDYGSQRFPCPR